MVQYSVTYSLSETYHSWNGWVSNLVNLSFLIRSASRCNESSPYIGRTPSKNRDTQYVRHQTFSEENKSPELLMVEWHILNICSELWNFDTDDWKYWIDKWTHLLLKSISQAQPGERLMNSEFIDEGEVDWMSWTHGGDDNDDRKFLTTSVVAEMKDLEIIILLEITFTAKVGAELSPR